MKRTAFIIGLLLTGYLWTDVAFAGELDSAQYKELPTENMVEFCAATIAASGTMSTFESMPNFILFWDEESTYWEQYQLDMDLVQHYYNTLMAAYAKSKMFRIEAFHGAYNCRDARLGK